MTEEVPSVTGFEAIQGPERKFLETGIVCIRKAGEVLREYYKRAKEIPVAYKDEFFDPGSVVSEADRRSQEVITEILKFEFPEHGIWGEEDTAEGRSERKHTWYIDPLDGTSNFLRKFPLWGISLGLAEEGAPIVGLLYFPEENLLLRATKGGGAFANDTRIHVSSRSIEKALYFARGYFKGKSYFDDRLAKKFGQTKIIDASSYELAQIAMGNGELYILPSVPHDVAAGALIVEEAGGKVTDAQGNAWNIKSRDIVVSNGVIHDEVLATIRG